MQHDKNKLPRLALGTWGNLDQLNQAQLVHQIQEKFRHAQCSQCGSSERSDPARTTSEMNHTIFATTKSHCLQSAHEQYFVHQTLEHKRHSLPKFGSRLSHYECLSYVKRQRHQGPALHQKSSLGKQPEGYRVPQSRPGNTEALNRAREYTLTKIVITLRDQYDA